MVQSLLIGRVCSHHLHHPRQQQYPAAMEIRGILVSSSLFYHCFAIDCNFVKEVNHSMQTVKPSSQTESGATTSNLSKQTAMSSMGAFARCDGVRLSNFSTWFWNSSLPFSYKKCLPPCRHEYLSSKTWSGSSTATKPYAKINSPLGPWAQGEVVCASNFYNVL